ncbi:Copia protein [Lentinula edodes]|uniref:Copia protein n=1 Tax=Lentinula edodes TaxID=5353 RepID=A0A1Q3ENK7_LENED|nr:Copia protein [Lentinula edodes]
MREHYIRERVKDGSVKVIRVRSGENVADITTKALSGLRMLESFKCLIWDHTHAAALIVLGLHTLHPDSIVYKF